MQNAFLRAHRALARFAATPASTWYYRILVNEVQRQRRWSALRRLFGAEHETAPEPATRATRDPGLQRRIAAALEHLSAGQREAFVLVHLEELTVNEAAEVLGKAAGTVKSHRSARWPPCAASSPNLKAEGEKDEQRERSHARRPGAGDAIRADEPDPTSPARAAEMRMELERRTSAAKLRTPRRSGVRDRGARGGGALAHPPRGAAPSRPDGAAVTVGRADATHSWIRTVRERARGARRLPAGRLSGVRTARRRPRGRSVNQARRTRVE